MRVGVASFNQNYGDRERHEAEEPDRQRRYGALREQLRGLFTASACTCAHDPNGTLAPTSAAPPERSHGRFDELLGALRQLSWKLHSPVSFAKEVLPALKELSPRR